VLLIESRSVFTWREQPAIAIIEEKAKGIVAADRPDWLQQLRSKIVNPSVKVTGPPNVRAVVHDQEGRTIVHLYNLNIQRLSSFEDKVMPATDVGLSVSTTANARSVRVLTADADATTGPLKFQAVGVGNGSLVEVRIPRLDVGAFVVIEP
jgi:hypothetical protein